MPSKQDLPQLTNAAGCLDKTGVGEGPYEEIKQFIRGMEGVTLTAQVKEDIMGKLKLALEQGRLILPRDNPQLLVQMTAQQCEATKSGTLKFSHPAGTHDDQLWSSLRFKWAKCYLNMLHNRDFSSDEVGQLLE